MYTFWTKPEICRVCITCSAVHVLTAASDLLNVHMKNNQVHNQGIVRIFPIICEQGFWQFLTNRWMCIHARCMCFHCNVQTGLIFLWGSRVPMSSPTLISLLVVFSLLRRSQNGDVCPLLVSSLYGTISGQKPDPCWAFFLAPLKVVWQAMCVLWPFLTIC